MVTPFDDAGNLDYAAAGRLAAHLVENGSEGLVIAGTTGESPTISHEEQRRLFHAVREAVDVPILAGTGSNSTREAVELTEYVTKEGVADACLVVSPYYNRPPQSGIHHYFSTIAQATDLPVVMYDIPVRTGRKIDHDTMVSLAVEHRNIRALKDAAGDPEATSRLLADTDLPSDFVVYSGDDALNLDLARRGAVGAISVASHWAGDLLARMFDALEAGDVAQAAVLHGVLGPSYEFETSVETPNPIPTKAMLRTLGLREVGYGRPPMVLASRADDDALEARAREVHRRLREAIAELGPVGA
jgi:4-hydroxy-tetrahydrodipicolinate synthase